MQKITEFGQELSNNQIIANPEKSKLENDSYITFNGSGNILFVEDGVKLSNSRIAFNGDNALVYLSKSQKLYYLDISANFGSCVFIGQENYFNGKLNLITSERKNIIIGSDCLFSFGIFIRVADPHLIYSCSTKERLNQSKSVLIGDHVWIGQNALVLKGTVLGSGSILGGGSVITNKTIPSNSSAAGNPAKIISEGIFYSKECVHNFNEEQTKKYQKQNSSQWIYSEDTSQIGLKKLDDMLCEQKTAQDKLNIIIEKVAGNSSKNRFYAEKTIKHKSPFAKAKAIFGK